MKKKATTVKKPVKSAPAKTTKAKAAPKNGLQDFIYASLDGDKAQDIVTIDLKGKTTIADYMLVATGTSSRHVIGMAQKLRDKLSAERKIKPRVEGLDSGDWVIVDAGDVIVHLFREEVRAFYNLEKLWGMDFQEANFVRYQAGKN